MDGHVLWIVVFRDRAELEGPVWLVQRSNADLEGVKSQRRVGVPAVCEVDLRRILGCQTGAGSRVFCWRCYGPVVVEQIDDCYDRLYGAQEFVSRLENSD